ncbi:hypothetical protein VSDG_02453 [Cytospora chrysosperma]|uniref:DUF2415 domain-containing protein n=1 Tax=Cytospora chrysosperma TaxID=252740 RepID=A0A423WGB7_CYTCH|nr:hypothetical protein VSDG_02453 [Valsa sordida]
MAVMDDRIYHPTDALVHQKPRQHYRVGLHVEHWQLRSQIGLSSPRHIYYVGGNGNTQIHKLDTAAHESETIKILTFAPRCLVAKNGWICAGGEYGEFVAFPVTEGNEEHGRGRSDERDPYWSHVQDYVNNGPPDDADRDHLLDAFRDHVRGLSPDERLQLGMDPPSNNDSDDSMPSLIPAAQSNSDKNLVARSKTFGKERVNCITLWFPPSSEDERHHGAYSRSVAILANNDKNVTIVGLEDQEALDELPLPDCVNRALISPDGRLLIAVCDDPYLYVHERVQRQTASQGLFTHKESFEWRQCAKIHLKSQRTEDRSDQRGSFAACFSNNGRLLAVGTQYGVISIFDVASLTVPGSDPLITTFNSSRPKEDVGAVRDMAFCPGPFDLLAWTEHRGRVGVADMRNNYVSRQTLNLGDYDCYEQIMVTERGSIDPRLLERNDRGELSYSDMSTAENRRRRQATDYHSPLTNEETMVLEALQEHRRRREQAAARNQSSGTSMSRLMERIQSRNTTAYLNDSNSRLRTETSNARRVGDILSDIQSQRDRLRDQSDRMREQSERVRARRFAVDEAERRRLADTSRTLRAPLVLPQSTESPRQVYINNSYTDLETLNHSAFEGGAPAPGSGTGPYEPGQGESTGNRARDYLASVWTTILRDRDMETDPPSRASRNRLADRVLNLNLATGRVDREHDDTAGLAWSEDGQTLIIGAEDGIYEFHVNLFNRKVFPSMEMR